MRNFAQVDVFAEEPYRGNPLAVVLDAEGLTEEEMARFANWTNLSETTFLLPPSDPTADYRVRIFTPSTEYPFAGHPTLGSCHAWLESGGVPKADQIIQECGAGLIPIRRDGDRLAFAAPPVIRGGDPSVDELEQLCAILQLDRSEIVAAQWVDNGPGWIAVLLENADAVLAVRPDAGAAESFDIGLAGRMDSDIADLEVRALYKAGGHAGEDPVTGSLNASLAQWLLRDGLMTSPYVARQGTVLGRSGRVVIEEAGDEIWVGGSCVTCVSGEVAL